MGLVLSDVGLERSLNMKNLFAKVDFLLPLATGFGITLFFLVICIVPDKTKNKTLPDLKQEQTQVIKLAIEKGWTPEQVQQLLKEFK